MCGILKHTSSENEHPCCILSILIHRIKICIKKVNSLLSVTHFIYWDGAFGKVLFIVLKTYIHYMIYTLYISTYKYISFSLRFCLRISFSYPSLTPKKKISILYKIIHHLSILNALQKSIFTLKIWWNIVLKNLITLIQDELFFCWSGGASRRRGTLTQHHNSAVEQKESLQWSKIQSFYHVVGERRYARTVA